MQTISYNLQVITTSCLNSTASLRLQYSTGCDLEVPWRCATLALHYITDYTAIFTTLQSDNYRITEYRYATVDRRVQQLQGPLLQRSFV